MSRLTQWLGLLSLLTIFVALALLAGNAIERQYFEVIFGIALAGSAIAVSLRIGMTIQITVITLTTFVAVMVALWLILPDIRFAPYLAVVLANGLVAYMFARGQMPGRTPLILQLIRLIGSGPVVSEKFRRFIYWQCWAWVALGVATSGAGAMAMFSPNLRPIFGATIAALAIGQIGWFVISHSYARWRHHRPETCLDTIKAMSRPSIWGQINL